MPVSTGIEQIVRITRKAVGAGPVIIDIPVSGLTAVSSGVRIILDNSSGQVAATYSDLRVTDSRGDVVPSSMAASSDGSAINITVHDSHAAYPLTIDPTWTTSAGAVYELYNNEVPGVQTPFLAPINPYTGATGAPAAMPVGFNPPAFDTMAVAPDGQTAYVLGDGSSGLPPAGIIPINLATGAVGAEFSQDYNGPSAIAITPDGKTALVVDYGEGDSDMYAVNLATETAGPALPLPYTEAMSLAITPNGQTAYIAVYQGVVPVNITTGVVGPLISLPGGEEADSIAITPNGETAYVTSFDRSRE